MSRDPRIPDSPPRMADATAQADPAPAPVRRPDRQAAPAPSDREARMAEALRANLQRRKAQARARAGDAGDANESRLDDRDARSDRAVPRAAPDPEPAPDN